MSIMFFLTFNILGGSLNLLDLILIVTHKKTDARPTRCQALCRLCFGEFPLLALYLVLLGG